MSTMSLKEKAVLAVLGMVVLYALAVGLWFMTQNAAWKKSMKSYRTETARYESQCKLIGERRKWEETYETEKSFMPSFGADDYTDTHWMSKMDAIAATNNLVITSRIPGKETSNGDVYEWEITVGRWDGSLQALVGFMHELENGDAGMFDLKKIDVKPNKSNKGYLNGSFTLTCAYMREED